MKRISLPLEYDSAADGAYVTFSEADSGERVGPGRTVDVALPSWVRGGLVIDFDAQGRIMGIEITRPSRSLRPDLLQRLRAAEDHPLKQPRDGR